LSKRTTCTFLFFSFFANAIPAKPPPMITILGKVEFGMFIFKNNTMNYKVSEDLRN
jgi:hypothetical protein